MGIWIGEGERFNGEHVPQLVALLREGCPLIGAAEQQKQPRGQHVHRHPGDLGCHAIVSGVGGGELDPLDRDQRRVFEHPSSPQHQRGRVIADPVPRGGVIPSGTRDDLSRGEARGVVVSLHEEEEGQRRW